MRMFDLTRSREIGLLYDIHNALRCRWGGKGMLVRFLIYGALGWCVEIVWTALGTTLDPERRNWRLVGVTYLWMFPVYGLLAPLYEPLHDGIRAWLWPLRALIYGLGFMAVEYVAGWLLRKFTGSCPWDYTGRARWHLHGLMRWDYGPLWAALGLGLEPVHDFLVRLTPAIYAAL